MSIFRGKYVFVVADCNTMDEMWITWFWNYYLRVKTLYITPPCTFKDNFIFRLLPYGWKLFMRFSRFTIWHDGKSRHTSISFGHFMTDILTFNYRLSISLKFPLSVSHFLHSILYCVTNNRYIYVNYLTKAVDSW